MLRRTFTRGYRYQEFEYSKSAQMTFYYPREAPNTSYFPQFILGHYVFFGWSREELWLDRDERRYQTTWQIFRKLLLVFFPAFYIFPIGLPNYFARELYGPYGEKSYMPNKFPFDNNFIEEKGSGHTLDPEWIRHIHSRDSF